MASMFKFNVNTKKYKNLPGVSTMSITHTCTVYTKIHVQCTLNTCTLFTRIHVQCSLNTCTVYTKRHVQCTLK